ncbi:hypothetical protein BH24CHL5_BH24CHL5_04560 [soil metagenome]
MEQAIELAIVFVVLAPFLRLMTSPPFLRRLGTAPGPAVGGAGALIGAIGISSWAALNEPWILRSLSAGSIVALSVGWWRARPDFGRNRGLPPGSLSVAALGPWVDPDFFAKQAARHGAIFKTSSLIKPTVCVVGWPLALDLFRNHDESLTAPAARFSRNIPRGFVRYMSDPDHARYSPLLRSALSPTITRRAEAQIGESVRSSLQLAANKASARPDKGVAANKLISRIVLLAFIRLFYGADPRSTDAERLIRLHRTVDPTRAWRSSDRAVRDSLDQLAGFARIHATDDSFIGSALRANPANAQDDTLLKNLIYMVQTSHSDVSGLLTWVIWHLTRDPTWVTRLRADDDSDQAARRIVMETLRLEQSEYISRRTTREIRWQGFVIPRGWRVRICVRENHRDPSLFNAPERFDPDRFRDAQPSRETYSVFGAPATRTSCLGPNLTLTLGGIFVRELVQGFDWSATREAPPEFSGVHWRPSTRFQIALRSHRQGTLETHAC